MQYLSTLAQDWRRPFWLTLLIGSSVALTLVFACAVPFAAFAAVAALTLARRDALYLAVGVWLANQVVGFVYLHYPWDANCCAWGAILALTAVVSTLAAQQVASRTLAIRWFGGIAVFLAAFAAYEATLYLASLVMGGEDDFTAAIQGPIFAVNAIAMGGLWLLHQLGAAVRIAPINVRPAHA